MKIKCVSRVIPVFVMACFAFTGFSQTKGFIYQPSTNSTIRAVLDPNGDGYTSLTTSGFSGTDDFGTNSELRVIALPALFNEQSGDVITGASGGHTDIVSNGASHGVSVLVKTVSSVQYLIVRFRIGKASTASKGYSLLIDSDNSFGTYLSSNNPGYDREIILETGNPGSVKIYQHTATTTTLQTYSASEYSQRSIAASAVDSDADYFYDFCVPLSAINAASAVRITAATITSAQSGIGGTVSDFNGIPKYENQFQAMKDVTNSFPTGVLFTDLVDGFSFPQLKSVPPVVTSSLTTASTTVTGTSTEANGTIIKLYRNRSNTITELSVGTVTVSGNAWTANSGISGQLQQGDLIYATASASGRSESGASNNIEVVSATCYTPRPAITARANGQQEISGTWAPVSGTITASTVVIKLYYENGTSLTEEVTTAPPYYVAVDGTFLIKANQSQPTFAGRAYYVTATLSGCESGVSSPIVGSDGTVTLSPTINTATILASASTSRNVQVTNNDPTTSTLILYQNGVEVASQSGVLTGASHTFSYTGFIEGANIIARAQSSTVGNWLSGPSNTVVVTASAVQTTAPVISGSYTAGSGKTVSGTCDEAAGTTISLYKAGSTLLGTTTVNIYGAWSISGLTLNAADVLTATAKATGETLSATSNSVTIAASAPPTPTITTTPILANSTTSASGTGAVAGGVVILYIDGEQIGSVSTPGAGAWTVSGITASSLYKGGTITAVNSLSNVLGSASTGVQVTGVTSFLITNTSDGAISNQTAGVAFDIKIVAKDGVGGTGSTFTNYSGSNSLGATYAITNGSTTTTFTGGEMASHSITVTKAGVYTLTTLATSDPTIVGTTTFTIVPNDATKLVVNTQASTQNSVDEIFGTQPILYVTDAYENRRTFDNTGNITVTIKSGTTGANLTGLSLLKAVSGGTADYSLNSLKIDRPGEYVLTFASSLGLTSVDSDPIYVGRVWKGSNDTDFNTSGNWSNSTIPNANDDIAFAQAPTSHLYLDGNRTITNYYNNSTNSKQLVVNGKKLTIKGSINHSFASINAAGSAASPSEIEFAGTGAQTVAANTFVGDSAYKININNAAGVNLNGTLKINGVLAPTSGVLTTNSHLTLRSYSVANTAVVSQGSSLGGYISGNVTVERYIPPRRAFRIITSPVTTTGTIKGNWQEGVNNTAAGYTNNLNPQPGYGTHITGPQGAAAGFDVTQSTNSSLFSFNNATQSWSAITNTNATTLQVGVAYRLMIRGDRSIDYSTNTPTPTYTVLRMAGTLAQGDQNAVSLNNTSDAWNIIANPYQSKVKITAITRDNIKDRYYIWDPQMGTRGAWVSYDFATGKSIPETAIDSMVQPGQAFFMQTTANGPASVTFNESDKDNTTEFTQVYKGNSVISKLYASLYYTDSLTKNAMPADGFGIAFDPSFTNNNSDDLHKLSNLDENFGIERDGKLLSVEKRQFPIANDSIHIHVNQYRDLNYTIRLKWENPVTAGTNAFLVDKYTNTEYLLSTSSITDVQFVINPGIAATTDARRFVIVFKNSNPLPVTGIELTAKRAANDIAVRWIAMNEYAIDYYEVQKSINAADFKFAFKTNATNNDHTSPVYNWLDQQPANGKHFYRIRAVSKDGKEQLSAIVTVNVNDGAKAEIFIAPNPVSNRTVQYRVNGLKAGTYFVNIVDGLGKIIVAKQLTHDGSTTNYSVTLPPDLRSGVLYMVVKGEKYLQTASFGLN